jgi:hypothetical protein
LCFYGLGFLFYLLSDTSGKKRRSGGQAAAGLKIEAAMAYCLRYGFAFNKKMA